MHKNRLVDVNVIVITYAHSTQHVQRNH